MRGSRKHERKPTTKRRRIETYGKEKDKNSHIKYKSDKNPHKFDENPQRKNNSPKEEEKNTYPAKRKTI